MGAAAIGCTLVMVSGFFDWRGSVVVGAFEDVETGSDGAFVDLAEAGDAVEAFAVGAAQLFEDFGIVFAVLLGGLAVADFAAQLAAVADVFVAATVEAELDVLALHFGHCPQYGNENHKEWVGLAVGLEDGELLLLKVYVDVAVLAIEDVVQYVLGVAAQAGQLADQQDVDFLGDAVDEAFVQDGAFVAFFCSGDFFGEGLGNLDVVGLGVVGEVFDLALGVLSVAEGTNAGVDDGFFHWWGFLFVVVGEGGGGGE